MAERIFGDQTLYVVVYDCPFGDSLCPSAPMPFLKIDELYGGLRPLPEEVGALHR